MPRPQKLQFESCQLVYLFICSMIFTRKVTAVELKTVEKLNIGLRNLVAYVTCAEMLQEKLCFHQNPRGPQLP